MQMVQKMFPTYEHDNTEDFETQFGPLPEIIAYDIYIVDPRK